MNTGRLSQRRIYADHAATTQLCDAAWEAMTPFLRENFGNPSSLHSWARKPRKAVLDAREIIARCIGAEPEEIFFTSGGTESDNWVIKGSSGGLIVSAYEHHAILNAAASEVKRGRDVVYAGVAATGLFDNRMINAMWKPGTGLVSVMAANNEIGVRNDLKALATQAHQKKTLFHTDAVQAVGHIPINVRECGIDFLSASAHKFNGPKGIGFLFKRKGLELSTLIHGGQQESGMRAGTENVASIVGMAAALKWNCDHLDEHAAHLNKLKSKLVQGLVEIVPDASFPGSSSHNQLPGFISVSLPEHPAEGLLHMLDLKGIAVSSGAACDSRNTQISHVLKAIGLPADLATCTLRISFGVENTSDDVEAIVSAFKRLLNR